MTKSGVIGLSPMVPRTPSVPKYLRVIVERFPDSDDVPRCLHVVDAQYSRPALQGEQSHRQAAGATLLPRPAGDLLQGGLPGETGEDRQLGELRQALQQDQVVLDRLAEAETGVDHDPGDVDST